MADLSIYDDFEEPVSMSKAFCQQVSDQEYANNVATETDKALGELCFLLDQQPELYAKVLRKRKREEVENNGVLSFMKSKMLGLVQGDEYIDKLVSDSDCLKLTDNLKAGICRTFQYAQDIKEEELRHSKRQASKVASKRIEKLRPNKRRGGENARTTISANGMEKMSHSDCGDGQHESHTDTSNTESQNVNCKKIDEIDKGTFDEISLPSDDVCNHNGSYVKIDNMVSSNNENNDNQANERMSESKAVIPPPPPPPPPGPPPPLPSHMPSNILHNLTPNVKKLTDGSLSQIQTSPNNGLRTISSSDINASLESSMSMGRRSRYKESDCHQSKSDIELSNVTPGDLIGRRLRSQRHSGSMTSLSSIHSELMSSNPVSRLKVTQVVRSPGGTPLRPEPTSRLPSEPLHKALVTAVRSKFKNVHTPSPRSALSSANNSERFSFTP